MIKFVKHECYQLEVPRGLEFWGKTCKTVGLFSSVVHNLNILYIIFVFGYRCIQCVANHDFVEAYAYQSVVVQYPLT